MKKFKVFALMCLLMFGMSSCVYSLFPIYTQETLVFLPELVGKWQTNPDDADDYIEFIPMSEKLKILSKKQKEMGLVAEAKVSNLEINQDTDGDKKTYKYTMAGDGWSIKSDTIITVDIDGEEVADPAQVRAYYDDLFGDMQEEVSKKPILDSSAIEGLGSMIKGAEETFADDIGDLVKGLQKLGQGLKKATADFKGTTYVSTEEFYKMVVQDEEDRMAYQAHLAQIGEDYFLDIYPLPEYTNDVFSDNLFPVHTFFKVNIENGQLNLTMFDLEKLNELFESNLIRLRHEYVNGNVLITAQPKEIQKFLDKYSDDESVFETTEIYSRID